MPPIATMRAVVLDCPDPRALARFYSAVIGWPVTYEDDDWVTLAEDGAGYRISFQRVEDHRPPVWPGSAHPQQFHLDVTVVNRAEAGRQVEALGAQKHAHQPGKDFTVYTDPAGHPFCLVDAD
ncbi:VOC family protein [Sphaerisporangium rubeum]|uniref:Catechol-2,3-dioxygenase n=1 Tax=Sphaerisporangium rubeum TaxID=321317 RepID=A0A7X0IC68_9ACTN|nr:VOC family protein [Sphaerisporangium rubeum]MBB6472541.1 catechol-2,3-dioxygenase [Sphaerisporangium rubeum]